MVKKCSFPSDPSYWGWDSGEKMAKGGSVDKKRKDKPKGNRYKGEGNFNRPSQKAIDADKGKKFKKRKTYSEKRKDHSGKNLKNKI